MVRPNRSLLDALLTGIFENGGEAEMRTIDADETKRAICQDQCELPDGCGGSCEMRDYIEDAPTIDAIPVKKFCEWLEECGYNIFKEAFTINVQLFRAAMEKGEKK